MQTSETTATSRESAIQEAKGSPMVGMMRPVSPTPSLKLIDAPAVEMTSVSSSPSKEEEEEEVSSKEQEVSSFLTPERRGLSPTSPTQQLNRRSSVRKHIENMLFSCPRKTRFMQC